MILILGGEQKNQAVKTDGICTCLCSAMGTGGGYVPIIIQTTLNTENCESGKNRNVK